VNITHGTSLSLDSKESHDYENKMLEERKSLGTARSSNSGRYPVFLVGKLPNLSLFL
jgi:hypothetical protein